jgi:hypothetical protein
MPNGIINRHILYTQSPQSKIYRSPKMTQLLSLSLSQISPAGFHLVDFPIMMLNMNLRNRDSYRPLCDLRKARPILSIRLESPISLMIIARYWARFLINMLLHISLVL